VLYARGRKFQLGGERRRLSTNLLFGAGEEEVWYFHSAAESEIFNMQTRLEGAFGAERSCRFSLSLSSISALPSLSVHSVRAVDAHVFYYSRVFLRCSGAECEAGRLRGAADASQERRVFFKHNYCTCVSGVSFSCGAAWDMRMGKHQREKRIVSSLALTGFLSPWFSKHLYSTSFYFWTQWTLFLATCVFATESACFIIAVNCDFSTSLLRQKTAIFVNMSHTFLLIVRD
jgi:hypothetical protein